MTKVECWDKLVKPCQKEPEGIEFASIERRPPRPTTTMTLTRNGENGIEVLLGLRADTMPAFPDFGHFLAVDYQELIPQAYMSCHNSMESMQKPWQQCQEKWLKN